MMRFLRALPHPRRHRFDETALVDELGRLLTVANQARMDLDDGATNIATVDINRLRSGLAWLIHELDGDQYVRRG